MCNIRFGSILCPAREDAVSTGPYSCTIAQTEGFPPFMSNSNEGNSINLIIENMGNENKHVPLLQKENSLKFYKKN